MSIDFVVHADRSITSPSGKILFFSGERFQREIVDGDACFLCGTSRDKSAFNDEHVIPDWVLRYTDIYDKRIVLPNGASLRYAEYKIPCCVECNRFLGLSVETPVSEALRLGLDGARRLLSERGPWPLFHWMALLFIKTHLKDRLLRFHLDRRKGQEPISAVHDWSLLHHVHCVARSVYTGAEVEPAVLGSLFVFETRKEGFEPFDYADVSSGALMIRLGSLGIVAVLNDASAALNLESQVLFPSISGPLSPMQLREVLARVAYLNLRLKYRPTHYSHLEHGKYILGATTEKHIYLKRMFPGGRGKIMHRLATDFVRGAPPKDRAQLEIHLKRGRWTFLYKSDGSFNEECDV